MSIIGFAHRRVAPDARHANGIAGKLSATRGDIDDEMLNLRAALPQAAAKHPGKIFYLVSDAGNPRDREASIVFYCIVACGTTHARARECTRTHARTNGRTQAVEREVSRTD